MVIKRAFYWKRYYSWANPLTQSMSVEAMVHIYHVVSEARRLWPTSPLFQLHTATALKHRHASLQVPAVKYLYKYIEI